MVEQPPQITATLWLQGRPIELGWAQRRPDRCDTTVLTKYLLPVPCRTQSLSVSRPAHRPPAERPARRLCAARRAPRTPTVIAAASQVWSPASRRSAPRTAYH